jgi:hypothetical protein
MTTTTTLAPTTTTTLEPTTTPAPTTTAAPTTTTPEPVGHYTMPIPVIFVDDIVDDTLEIGIIPVR